jgi:hypothetical protein
MPVIRDKVFKVDLPKLEGIVGLPGRRHVNEWIRDLQPEILADINDGGLIEAASCYEIVRVQRAGRGTILLDGGVVLSAPLLAHRLARASHILIGTATIGGAMADEIRRCFGTGRHLKAVLMEEVANAALFETANDLETAAQQRAEDMALNASGPLCPGDHDGFDLDQQERVITLAGAGRIGITITRTGQMKPIHSASVVIGLGRNLRRWDRIDDCRKCRSRDRCGHYRRYLETAK